MDLRNLDGSASLEGSVLPVDNSWSRTIFRPIAALRDWLCVFLVFLMDRRLPTFCKRLTRSQKDQIKSILQPGDIILETNNSYPGWHIASRLAFNSHWAHCALYTGDGTVIDAGSTEQVAELPIETFLGTHHIAILRPEYPAAEYLQSVLSYARSCLGRQFNRRLDNSTDRELYCSQLIARALRTMADPIEVPSYRILGKEITPPAAFLECPKIHCLWSTRPTIWTIPLSHWPVMAGAYAGAMAGVYLGRIGELLGAIAGAQTILLAASVLFPDLF